MNFKKVSATYVSYKTFNRLQKTFAYYYIVPGGTRRFKLPLIPDKYCMDGVAYFVFRGNYVGSARV